MEFKVDSVVFIRNDMYLSSYNNRIAIILSMNTESAYCKIRSRYIDGYFNAHVPLTSLRLATELEKILFL